MSDVQPIPDGYPRVIPYLTVDGASAAIDFYARVLGTTERVRMPGPG
ncbi:MAG: VOC family protein, partial [Actinomycetota bacterium]|nr:VOC family protein [Actinomycetota bacterium]